MSGKTICTTCLRLKQGYCDGEKELTACPSYKRMTNADCIRAYTDEQIAEMLSHFPCPASDHGCHDCLKHMGDCKACWLDWLKQEVEE